MPNTIVPMPDTPSNPSPALLPKVEQWSYAEQANASPPSYPLEDFPAAFEYVAGEHTPRFLSWADQGNIVGIRTPWPEDAIALGRGYAARPHGLRGATLRTSTVLREAARMAEVLEKLKGAKTYTTFTLFIKSEHVGDVRTRELNHLRDQKNTFLEDAKIKFDNKLVNQIFFRVKDGTGDTFCQWVLDQFGAVLATPGIADGLSGDKAAAFKAELSKGQASFAKKYPPNTNAVAVHDSLKGLVGWWCAVEFSAKKGNVTITATGRIPLGVATITDAQPPLTVAEAIAAAGAQAPKGASLLERACTEGYHVYVLNSNESNEAIEASAPAIAEQTRADMINHKSATYWLNLHFNRGEKAARSVFVEFDDNDLKFLDDPQGDKPYDCGAIIFTPPWPVTRGPKSNYSVHVLRSELEKKASLERYFKPAGQTNKLEFWLKSRENAVRTLNWLATKAYNTVENRSFTQIIKSQWGHFSNEFNPRDLGKKVAVSAAGAGVVVGITVLTGGAAMAVIIAGLVVAGVQIPVIAKIEKPKVGGKTAADWFAFDEASGRLYPTQVVAPDRAKIDAAINTFVGNGGAVSADDPTINDAALLGACRREAARAGNRLVLCRVRRYEE